MRLPVITALVVGLLFLTLLSFGQEQPKSKRAKKDSAAVSFSKDVFPIIERTCLPCHAEENFNPSELSLDSYELMKLGGKHGDPWVAGNSKESLLMAKLSDDPPFGDRMPLNTKKRIKEGKAKWLTPEEIKVFADWIDQGAKEN